MSSVEWLLNCDFPTAARRVAEYLGIGNERSSGNGQPDVVADIAQRKRVPLESWKAFGAHEAKRGKLIVCRLPLFGPDGKKCSHFDLATIDGKWLKGLAVRGKPAGVFLEAGRVPQPGDSVCIVEGPKDANALSSLGYQVIGLVGKLLTTKFARLFRGCDVVVVPDRDAPGEEAAKKTAARLAGVARSVAIAHLPGELKARDGDGVREVLARRDGESLLRQAIADAQPWTPARSFADGEITNVVMLNRSESLPVPMAQILEAIEQKTDNWPRRVGPALFIHREGHPIAWLENTAALFGWLGARAGAPSRFSSDTGLHTKAEVFAELQRTAMNYEAVEELPHEPKLRGHYYACSFPEAGDGSKLRGLVDRFEPETLVDTDLITALFVSAFWGAAGGTKPAFLLTADAGRGVGKSTLAAMVGYVANGHIELSSNENAEVLKQRLLSPEGITRRVALLDNVKSLRFSWAELESMITAPFISGKRLYVGEARRPNNLAWVITLNGASLATDLAQRCVIIKLRKPEHSGNWLEETRQYIDNNRQQIIGDIIGFLQSERHELRRHSRWGAWERDVLSRLSEPEEAQAVILERQGEVNVEHEESKIIEQAFAARLESLTYSAQSDVVFLPSSLISRWMSDTMNDRISTVAASRMLKQKIDEGELKRMKVNPSRTHGRGFLWVGPEAEHDSQTLYDIEHRIEISRREN